MQRINRLSIIVRASGHAHYALDRYYRHIWDISMIIIISLVLIIIPYQASIGIREKKTASVVIKNILLLICCCDIIVNLRTG